MLQKKKLALDFQNSLRYLKKDLQTAWRPSKNLFQAPQRWVKKRSYVNFYPGAGSRHSELRIIRKTRVQGYQSSENSFRICLIDTIGTFSANIANVALPKENNWDEKRKSIQNVYVSAYVLWCVHMYAQQNISICRVQHLQILLISKSEWINELPFTVK